jgi:hypothetical protein
MMVLQNCIDFLKVEPGLSDETCPSSSHDRDQMIDVKVEEGHIPITLNSIKAEDEVSCMSVCPLLGK